MKSATSIFVALAICAAGPVVAQSTQAQPSATPSAPPPPATPPCSGPEHRQLDFWVGEWIATWTNPNGSQGTGRNVITRNEYGDCVITERFSTDDGSFKGFSISTYVTPAREWRQTWMDDQGGYFDLFGGPVSGQPHIFALETYRRSPNARFARMIWENVSADGFTWRWQGKATADAEWADTWVIRYTKAPASAGGS